MVDPDELRDIKPEYFSQRRDLLVFERVRHFLTTPNGIQLNPAEVVISSSFFDEMPDGSFLGECIVPLIP